MIGDFLKVKPLAFESMGVRSMATYVETDHKILIDPGTSLGPKRFGYPPWKTEFDALYETRSNIQKHAKNADIVTISHYHHDHFTPFSLGRYQDSNPQYAEEIYNDKQLFIKNPNSQINKNQQKRANRLLRNLNGLNCEINYIDGNLFQVGDTVLKFSEALPHGIEGSRLGYVVAVHIKWDGQSLLHASDVQGPFFDGTKQFILAEKPDTLIISGPPIYLQGFTIESSYMDKARNNLIEIAQKIPRLIIDHHLLRDLRCFDFLEQIKEQSKGEVLVASELNGKKPLLLEARRKQLYFED
jgi:predicted metallo-beta-lactamase superfamily hydrolase